MNKEELTNIIIKEDWSYISKNIDPITICHLINFKNSMALAYDLFFKNLFDDVIQDFSIRLFFCIKNIYHFDWDQDWKNDVFLGKLCSLTWRYDEMFELYKRAYDKLSDPPESLLLLLASCKNMPGNSFINDQDSERYIEKALSKKLTFEVALMMKGLAQDRKDHNQELYWENMCFDLEKQNIHTEAIIPDILLVQGRS